MPAVMLNDEEPYRETGGGKRQQQRQPIGVLEGGKHHDEDGQKRNGRVQKLDRRPPRIGATKFGASPGELPDACFQHRSRF